MLYITVSRMVPSRRSAWPRSRRPFLAPRRSMARCDAKLKLSVRQPTTWQPRVSKAWPIISSLAVVLTWLRCTLLAVPGVANFHALHGGHDVVVAGGAQHRAGGVVDHGKGKRLPSARICRRRRCRCACFCGSGTEVMRSFHSSPSAPRAGLPRAMRQRFQAHAALPQVTVPQKPWVSPDHRLCLAARLPAPRPVQAQPPGRPGPPGQCQWLPVP